MTVKQLLRYSIDRHEGTKFTQIEFVFGNYYYILFKNKDTHEIDRNGLYDSRVCTNHTFIGRSLRTFLERDL